MKSRLEELEPLPEALQVTQFELQETRHSNGQLQKQQQEQSRLNMELQLKVIFVLTFCYQGCIGKILECIYLCQVYHIPYCS